MVKINVPDAERAHRVMIMCTWAIDGFRSTTGDAFSTMPRDRFEITMHPTDARALEMIIGGKTPGHPLIFAGMIVVEDTRFEAPVVSLAANEHQ